ncbi:MAG: hypothetical protein GXO74_12885 [Calditrichaeota bacterium]|nr:hypothetical protein [Calditrichota bacterium]
MKTPKKAKGKFLFYFFLIFLLLTILQISCQKNHIQTAWDAVQIIESRITPPVFPEREYRVTDFGAVGDSVTACFEPFKKAKSH